MNVSEKLDQEKLKELLFNAYIEGHDNKNVSALEIIHEIESQIKSIMESPK